MDPPPMWVRVIQEFFLLSVGFVQSLAVSCVPTKDAVNMLLLGWC